MYKLRGSIPSSIKLVNIVVNKTSVPYDLSLVQQAVPRNRLFSQMNTSHFDASTELTKILAGSKLFYVYLSNFPEIIYLKHLNFQIKATVPSSSTRVLFAATL